MLENVFFKRRFALKLNFKTKNKLEKIDFKPNLFLFFFFFFFN